MPIRFLTLAALLAAAFTLSLAASSGSASAFECEQQINKVLQEHSIDQSDVKSVKVVRRTGGSKSASIYSLDAWIRLNSCGNGALIVNMTKYCMVQNVYTTGDCSIAGVKSY